MLVSSNDQRCAGNVMFPFLDCFKIAKASFSYVEAADALGPRVLLKNVIGLPPCMRTAPIPDPLASASSIKGFVKSGKARTGVKTSLS